LKNPIPDDEFMVSLEPQFSTLIRDESTLELNLKSPGNSISEKADKKPFGVATEPLTALR